MNCRASNIHTEAPALQRNTIESDDLSTPPGCRILHLVGHREVF